MADPDLQVSGGDHPDSKNKRGAVLENNFSQPCRPCFGLKIRWGPGTPGPSPRSATFLCFPAILIHFQQLGLDCRNFLIIPLICFSLGNEGYILFSTRFDIRRLRFDTSLMELIISGQKGAIGLDFDFDTGNIYWSDALSDTIQRVPVKNSPHIEVVIKDNLDQPDDIAVDWINKKLYWTDAGTKRIEVADLDGGNRLVLVQLGLVQPRAIAVHPFLG